MQPSRYLIALLSRSSISKRLSDKLVYIFVAIESLFVRDGAEHLQSNFGERMAFFAENEAESRKSVGDNLKKAYAIRSSPLPPKKDRIRDPGRSRLLASCGSLRKVAAAW